MLPLPLVFAILKRVSTPVPFATSFPGSLILLPRASDLILEWTCMMHLLCLISIIVALYGAMSARGYQTKFENCKIGLPEFSPFQIKKLAQVFCWMNLAEKVWKTKDLNNWLRLWIKSIIIFPHRTWGGFSPEPQMYTRIILETLR